MTRSLVTYTAAAALTIGPGVSGRPNCLMRAVRKLASRGAVDLGCCYRNKDWAAESAVRMSGGIDFIAVGGRAAWLMQTVVRLHDSNLGAVEYTLGERGIAVRAVGGGEHVISCDQCGPWSQVAPPRKGQGGRTRESRRRLRADAGLRSVARSAVTRYGRTRPRSQAPGS